MMKRPQGLSALFAVVVVGFLLLFTTITMFSVVIRQAALRVVEQDAAEARDIVRGCLDEVLIWMTLDSAYSEPLITTLDGTCSLSVSASTPTSQTVQLSTAVDNVTYGVEVVIETDPVQLSSLVEQLP